MKRFLSRLLSGMLMVLAFVNVANAQQVLRIITWKGYIPKELQEKFEKETGIKLKITYSNNEEMLAKLRATRGGGFDLAQPSADRILFAAKKYKIYQPMDYTKIEAKNIKPTLLKATKDISGGYAVPYCFGTTGLIVNKKYAPDANDWSDLYNPKYAGHIAYRLKRPLLIGVAFAMGYNPFKLYNNTPEYKKMINNVAQKLIDTKSYVYAYWNSGDQQREFAKSGKVWVETGWDGIGWNLHKENPDIDFIAPKSGALGWIDTFAIPKRSKNVEGAYKFINFMLKPENAAVFVNHERYQSGSNGVEKYVKKEIKADWGRTFDKKNLENIKWYPALPAACAKIEAEALERIKAAASR